MIKALRWLRARWRVRHVDPDVCCCGGNISHRKAVIDSICAHAGRCRSAREYAITCEVNTKGKS